MATRQFLYSKNAAPTVNDDTTQGYKVGDEWLDTTNGKFYKVLSVTAGAANWKEFSITSSLSDLLTGWISQGSTWTYSSADGSTGVVSINSDVTTILQKGTRVKYSQSQALTAYFPMDSNSTATVGTFTSTDTSMTYTAGKFSNAATFNGTTSKIVITDTALMKPTGEFTLGLWMKSSVAGGKLLFQSLSKNTNWAGFYVGVSASSTIEALIGKNTGATLGTDATYVSGSKNICDNAWHYIVLTYRNNYLQVYVDGVLEVASYSYAPAYAATNYVRIGCYNTTGTDGTFMNGQIDDIYLINGYALDEKTIYDKYVAATAQGTGSLTLTKYGIVTAVGAYSGGVTLVTFWGGTDFSLANATVSSPYYSNMKVPFGFNPSVDKWSVLLSDANTQTQSSPAAATWYNLGSLSLSIPIGSWKVNYSLSVEVVATYAAAASVPMRATLSTSSSAESDASMSCAGNIIFPVITGATARASFFKEKVVNLTTKTTHYLLGYTGGTGNTSLAFSGGIVTTFVKATLVYL